MRSLISDSLDRPGKPLPPDADDVPPAVFIKAIWDEALDRTEGLDTPTDVNLDVFLRAVVARVVGEMKWERRFNVGKNRHFPRMVQYVREVEDETTWDEGCGLHLMNRAGSGSVAAYPTSPHGLKVKLDARWL